jgi:hypothetical protein
LRELKKCPYFHKRERENLHIVVRGIVSLK